MKKILIILAITACIMSFCCYPITALSGNNTTKSNNVEQLMTFVGHRVVGNYSVSEALDLFVKDGMNSLIIDYLFDGDIELAKITLDKLFGSTSSKFYIDMERYFDEDVWDISEKNESLYIGGDDVSLYIFTYGSLPSKIYTKHTTSAGEYYTDHTGSWENAYFIDLGNNVVCRLDMTQEFPKETALEYGLMLKDLVADKWQESTEAPTEAPTETASCGGDTESSGCGSIISGSMLILAPITALGAFYVSKRKKKD